MANRAWLDEQAPGTLHLTAVTVAELLAGVAALPAGRRRTRLARGVAEEVLPLFEGRVPAFDLAAARACATLHARARAAGHPIGFADGANAAIVAARGRSIATRNVHDLLGTGVDLIDPWAPGQTRRRAGRVRTAPLGQALPAPLPDPDACRPRAHHSCSTASIVPIRTTFTLDDR